LTELDDEDALSLANELRRCALELFRDAAQLDLATLLQASTELWSHTWSSMERDHGWRHTSFRESSVFGRLLSAFAHCALTMTLASANETQLRSHFQSAVESLDVAQILEAPGEVVQTMLALVEAERMRRAVQYESQIAAAANETFEQPSAWIIAGSPVVPPSASALTAFLSRVPFGIARQPIERRTDLNANRIVTHYLRRSRPLVLSQSDTVEWNALRLWSDMRLLRYRIGHRTLPFEVHNDEQQQQQSQSDDRWRETPMRVANFIDNYVVPDLRRCNAQLRNSVGGNSDVVARCAWLASPLLFDHIPELLSDLTVPKMLEGDRQQQQNSVMAWFSTSRCVTPLHSESGADDTQALDTVLVQVAGYRYVRLFDRSQEPLLLLRAAADRTEAGESLPLVQTILHDSDETLDARVRGSQYSDVVLAPGELLIIPSSHFYTSRTLTPSIAVLFLKSKSSSTSSKQSPTHSSKKETASTNI
jgi:hypothetical protein